MLYDVIVVGAGVAGSSTALLLARRGRSVLLVDRSRRTGEPGADHDLGPAGTALLDRWGMLPDPVATTGRVVTAGARTVPIRNGECLGNRLAAALPSRALAERLAQAAADAGATVRPGFGVIDAVWARGRVVGVVGRGPDDRCDLERGRIVVGADGHDSVVAHAGRALAYRQEPSGACCSTACWSGWKSQGPEAWFLDRLAVTVVPGLDGKATVTVWLPVDEWAACKRRPETTYLRQVERLPGLGGRLASARRVSRFRGRADLATGFRSPYGPGWALVGDAGHRTDPVAGRGLEEGLVQAQLLADALHAGLSQRGGPGRTLARYARARDERAGPIHEIACRIGSFRWQPSEIPGLLRALETARGRPVEGLAA